MTAPYAWIIDTDFIAEPEYTPPHNCNAVGMTGPRDAPDYLLAALAASPDAGKPFRILDDDGVVYYAGRITAGDGEHGFQPLDDFGQPNAGACTIQYKNASNEWESL